MDTFFRYFGFSFSRYLIHAGQQLVNMGKGPPFFSRSRNSADSSMTVRSAPKLVSYTSSAPIIFRAETSLSMALTPGSRPKASPTATRTAGAIWNTTRLPESYSTRQALPISSRMVIAPVGQAAAHWPQLMQWVSASFRSKAGITCRSLPRWAKFRMPMPCISSQMRTQSPQRIHLLGSRTMAGEEWSFS